MLTQHTYFNLDAFANPNTHTIWNHTLHLPHSHRVLAINGNALPTGEIVNIPLDAVDDFYSAPHQLGFADSTPAFVGHCGGGGSCDGYNGEWLVDAHTPDSAVKLTLASEWSGIKADLRTDQEGLVVYTCFWSDGSAQIKAGQGYEGGPRNITSGDCVAIEAQDWVDGINHPEWGRLDRQIWGPGERYSWEAEWEFGIV